MKTIPVVTLLAAFVMNVTIARAAVPAGWTDDYAKAVEKAKAEKKNLLLDFTGSDWCGYCIALDKEVFSTPKFKSWAKDNAILVKVDFPKSVKQSEKVKTQNKDLKTKFPFNGYPTVVVIDPEGKVLARKSGYHPGSGPATYLSELKVPGKTETAKP